MGPPIPIRAGMCACVASDVGPGSPPKPSLAGRPADQEAAGERKVIQQSGSLATQGTEGSLDDYLPKSATFRERPLERLPTFIDPHHGLRAQNSVKSWANSNVKDMYEVKEVMGCGSFGTVSKVTVRGGKGQVFAMKSIPTSRVSDPKVFQRELNIARRLKHPYIVELHQTFRDTEAYHLLMELCTGGDFLRLVRSSVVVAKDGRMTGGLSSDCMSRYLAQMLKGIAYLHNYQFAHRDIKPENYLLADTSYGSQVKLIDFGLARSFRQGRPMKSKVGSISYVAPEIVRSAGGYDARCDIWSVGVTACVMAVAKKPFPGGSVAEYLEHVDSVQSVVASPLWERHPQPLKDLISQMLSKDPKTRPQAADLLRSHEWLKHEDPPKKDVCCAVS